MIASYAIDSLPVFDGLAAANGRLYMASVDGAVRAYGAEGLALESKLGEPIEEIHEELIADDEEYRKKTEEFIGDAKTEWPRGRPQGGGGQALPKGKSLAAEFSSVADGKVVASELGYRLGARANQVALAIDKLDEPVEGTASWRIKMKGADGFPNPPWHRNGFFVFGDGTTDEKLVKCGLQFVRGTARIIQGPTNGQSGATAQLGGNVERTYTLDVSVDLAKQEVVLKTAGKSLSAKLDRRLESITHIGFASWNSVSDFSEIQLKE